MKVNYTNMRYTYIYIILSVLGITLPAIAFAGDKAQITESDNSGVKIWTIENSSLSFEVSYKNGAISPTAFYNKSAAVNYLGGGSQLFNYQVGFLPISEVTELGSSQSFTYKSNDSDWTFGSSVIDDIALSSYYHDVLIGKRLSVVITKPNIEIKLVFEIFDGASGLRYQTFIKNTNSAAKMIIESADIISLNLPKKSHNLHYVTNTKWLSTTGAIENSGMNNKGNNAPKCLINLYTSNDGWYIAPEVNWKTQYGPEVEGSLENPSSQGYDYMLRSFAEITAWANGSGFVKVSACPESFQLVLKPNEEFEYIAVNLTAFKGDIVDGKMAVEEHLRKRFRFHDTSTTFVVNDWDWFVKGKRNETFYKNVVIPKAKLAGFEMIMFDDGWNNPNDSGTGLNNDGLSRDPVEAGQNVISNMVDFTDYVAAQGLKFGLWYSMSGGNHNKGNDLADWDVIEAKKQKIQYMIDNYHLAHQAVDLTQYWQNMDETNYSHPSDNVYRKNVLTRNLMNDLVDANPEYVVKVTSELDIFPTQGNRSTELLHLPNNGWMTITGFDKLLETPGIFFGHLPMNALYVTGNPTGKMSAYYAYMVARNIKVAHDPDNWSDTAIALMSTFNVWRKSDRIQALTNNIVRPVYFGEGWDNPIASSWSYKSGPYLWMYTNENKSDALLLASNEGGDKSSKKQYPLRWLDEAKEYLVEDITLDDTGIYTYNFIGKFAGTNLNQTGIEVSSDQNTSFGKAFWIKEYNGQSKQVVYADSNVYEFSELISGNKLTINATGKPNSTGKIIVYGAAENDAMSVSISFDNSGVGNTEVHDIINNNVAYPGS